MKQHGLETDEKVFAFRHKVNKWLKEAVEV